MAVLTIKYIGTMFNIYLQTRLCNVNIEIHILIAHSNLGATALGCGIGENIEHNDSVTCSNFVNPKSVASNLRYHIRVNSLQLE